MIGPRPVLQIPKIHSHFLTGLLIPFILCVVSVAGPAKSPLLLCSVSRQKFKDFTNVVRLLGDDVDENVLLDENECIISNFLFGVKCRGLVTVSGSLAVFPLLYSLVWVVTKCVRVSVLIFLPLLLSLQAHPGVVLVNDCFLLEHMNTLYVRLLSL